MSSWVLLRFQADWAGEDIGPDPVDAPPQEASGGGQHFTAMPLMGARWQKKIDGAVAAVRPVTFAVPSTFEFKVPERLAKTLTIPGTVASVRAFEFSVSGIRPPSERYTALIREDEELLLSI